MGLKYKVGRCPTAIGIYHKVGSEQNPDGTYTSSTMQWCKFSDLENCIIGYFDFINISRYANLKGVTDPKTYLEYIKADGYATSLKYVDKLLNVIKSYDLTKYDEIEKQTKKYYRVQVGAYKSKTNATAMKKKLQVAGFSTLLKQIDGLYKIQIGAFSNKFNAEEMKKIVESKGFKAFIAYC